MKNRFLVALATLALSLTGCGSAGNGPTTVSNDRVVTVSAEPTLAQRIDAGQYEYVDSNIQSSFKVEPIAADYQAKLVVVHFNRGIGSADAVLEMQALGLRPANTAECLAYGAAQKRISREWGLRNSDYWLVCLGSIATFDGGRSVLALSEWRGVWYLGHRMWAGDWDSGNRFLATRP
jgi:hypothetical protein